MQFAEPEAFYLLLLPALLLVLLVWSGRGRLRAAEKLGEPRLIERLSLRVSRGRERWKSALVLGGLSLLVLFAGGGEPESRHR